MFKTNARRAVLIAGSIVLVLAVFTAASYVNTGTHSADEAPGPASAGPAAPGTTIDDQVANGHATGGRAAGALDHEDTAAAGAGVRAAGQPPSAEGQPGSAVAGRTDAPLTWAGLSALMRGAFAPAGSSDMAREGHSQWLAAGKEGSQLVTRAELATAIVEALDLKDPAAALMPQDSMYQDISPLHRAFPAVAMAHRLGLIPQAAGGMFRPEETVTVAEAEEWLAAVSRLDNVSGRLVQVNVPGASLSVVADDGETSAFVLAPETLVVRNAQASTAQQLRVDDVVHAVADATGQLMIVVAEGSSSTAAREALATLAEVLREILTPEQTAALLAQDWERAGTELKVSLYNQLLEHGLTPDEANAVLSQDWPAVTEHGKERLTELVAARWELEPELVRALLDQNWDTAVSYAEVMVLEYLLNELMEAANA
ncbi:MAG: hypothetical protein BAA04_10900 [Firmicutes bacterium ZCTH02-B6]|nr:MAG: hypothetical protein BAA04_10900 [Firmicutes bacterium ZCTH02-B6]